MKIASRVALALGIVVVSTAWVFGNDPASINEAARFSPPAIEHILGTDELGRDVLSRLFHGASSVLLIALGALVVPTLVGVPLGIVSGFVGRGARVITFMSETVLLVPDLLLVMFVISIVGRGTFSLIMALSVVYIPRYVRVVQGNVMRFRSQGYLLSLRARGVRQTTIISRHLLPLVFRQAMVQSSYNLGGTIFVTTTLGFLGIGLDPSAIEWGNMIKSSMPYLLVHPWPVVVYSCAALSMSNLFNYIGEHYKDYFRQHEYAT